jgi:hypothetical protein
MCGRKKGMKIRIVGFLAVTALCCGSLSASLTALSSAKKLTGKSIVLFNIKAQTPDGRENLRNLIEVENQVRSILKEESINKKKFSKSEVKRRTKTVIEPLQSYFEALWPGRDISKNILQLSLKAHDSGADSSYILQFLNQKNLASMITFFQKTIDDHAKLIRVCREFQMLANDIKKSLSPAVKKYYNLKYADA